MAHLLDSNILLRWANKEDAERPLALSAMRKLGRRREVLNTTPQNYIEFWSVATRSISQNGLGLTPLQAEPLLLTMRALFPLLPDNELIFQEWSRIVVAASVSGRQVHDARLASVMLAYGVSHILTFNTADFNRYHELGIVAIHPADV